MDVITLSAKTCMAHLLLKETFDQFSFIEGEITTFNKFTWMASCRRISSMTPQRARTPTGRRCAKLLSIIRGRRTPLSFKIVLSLAPENFAAFLEKHQIGACRARGHPGMYLNPTTMGQRCNASPAPPCTPLPWIRRWSGNGMLMWGKCWGTGGSCRNCGDWRAPGRGGWDSSDAL